MATLAQGLPFPGESATQHHHSSRPSPYNQPDPSAVRPRHYSGAADSGRYTESLATPQQRSGSPAGAAAAGVNVRGSGAVDVDRAPVRAQQHAHSYYAAAQGQGVGQPQPRELHAQQQEVDAGRAPSLPNYHAGSMGGNSNPVRPDSFFAVDGGSATYGTNGYAQPQDEGRETVRATGRATEAPHARVSSFYGTDGHIASSSRTPAQVHQLQSGDSPTRSTQSMQSVRPSTVDRSSKRDSNSGSGSGSHSSHSFEQQQHGAQHARPRMSQVPYSSSRAASLYGFPSSASNSAGDSIPPPPPAQLLDQSHLQVGNMASLLSHDKTLELYRLNAKKTNDPDIQYEFCVFVMDVVADLEYSAMLEKAAAAADGQPFDGTSQAPSDQEVESKQKQQALVAESIALLNRLATRGHVNSCYFLGDCYTQGIGTYKVSAMSVESCSQ